MSGPPSLAETSQLATIPVPSIYVLEVWDPSCRFFGSYRPTKFADPERDLLMALYRQLLKDPRTGSMRPREYVRKIA